MTVDGAGSPSAPYVISAAGGTPVTTACGLAGDGAGTPLAAAVQPWPYPCDVTAQGGGVYCDANGVLRSEPRGRTDYYQQDTNQEYPTPQTVPAASTVALSRTLNITNPDPCRSALVLVEVEIDVDFDLPAGAGAAAGIDTDQMVYHRNTGTTLVTDWHVQTTKVWRQTISPGGAATVPVGVTLSRGSGGATYDRIQMVIRAFIFVL